MAWQLEDERFISKIIPLECEKEAVISDRLHPVGAPAVWNWSRVPSGRTQGEFKNLFCLLAGVSLNHERDDSWKWSLAPNGLFSVKILSSLIDVQLLPINSHVHETLRNHLVPKKVELFVWRAIKKRLPVRIELDKRGIDLHSVRCLVCDDDVESVDHCLIF
ncbi:uncharacterized protein [Rutidosis leptorrhynchoides]|uniref:uncharacterized protein n=1 Tax=Rutidosis leptorrhynchoides TaxID=125765 RepID=UPI003A99D601